MAQLEGRELAVKPSVSAQVQKYRPFFILGEVQRPGQYPYVPGMSVLTAVSIAGGYTFRAETQYAAITRQNGEKIIKGRARQQTPVLPGDTIYVYEDWF
jgi:polysaccharide export outer membrane protein